MSNFELWRADLYEGETLPPSARNPATAARAIPEVLRDREEFVRLVGAAAGLQSSLLSVSGDHLVGAIFGEQVTGVVRPVIRGDDSVSHAGEWALEVAFSRPGRTTTDEPITFGALYLCGAPDDYPNERSWHVTDEDGKTLQKTTPGALLNGRVALLQFRERIEAFAATRLLESSAFEPASFTRRPSPNYTIY